MAKVYTLDEAINKIFEDREYYLSLSKSERSTFRSYKRRYKDNTMNVDAKLSFVKKYGFVIKQDILFTLKSQ